MYVLGDKCRKAGVPFYFKQGNGLYPGTDPRNPASGLPHPLPPDETEEG